MLRISNKIIRQRISHVVLIPSLKKNQCRNVQETMIKLMMPKDAVLPGQ